ncbi:MAG: hypothetical protein KDK70_28480, partial [Myxococcales bacterium]|nr:hypothetical protein [Myxococcales bacterium]
MLGEDGAGIHVESYMRMMRDGGPLDDIDEEVVRPEPMARQAPTKWSELRVMAPRSEQDAILLGEVAPWLEELDPAVRQSGAFYLRDRRGLHDRLRVWARTEASPSLVELARRVSSSARSAPPAMELVEDATLDFAEGTYTGPAAAPLIGGLLTEATPRLLAAIARIDDGAASRSDIALELMVSHL